MAVTGRRIDDGFPTLFGFGEGPGDSVDTTMGIVLWEKRIKPFGIDGGGPNDITTMRNVRWRTRMPKQLVTLTEMSCTVSYNPYVYNSDDGLPTYVQVNQPMYLFWPDRSQVNFWGWVDSFEPHEVVEGAQPEADLKICPSNWDDDNQEEFTPLYTEPSDL